MSHHGGEHRKGSRSAFGRAAGTWLVVLVAVFAALPGPCLAVEPEKKAPAWKVADASLVYLGNPKLFKKPAAVSADKVYRAIPEYREILEKNLTDKDVRYHFLMKKASDKFSKAIRDVAQEVGYDLVAGTGAVVPANTDTPAVPDVTTSAIAKLPA
jgi:hypothetical protein